MTRRPNILVRVWHDLLHTHTYGVDLNTCRVYERCARRLSGRVVSRKYSDPAAGPNFQHVGGA